MGNDKNSKLSHCYPNQRTKSGDTPEEILGYNAYVIFNPAVGGYTKKKINTIMKKLGTHFFEYYESKKKGDISHFVSKKLSKKGKYIFVICGGDGTYNEAINVKGNLKTAIFGFLPEGTSSDLAKSLGIKSTTEMCNFIDTILKGKFIPRYYVTQADLIKSRYKSKLIQHPGKKEASIPDKEAFAANMVSFGFDAGTCFKVEQNPKISKLGRKWAYICSTIKMMKEYVPIQTEINLHLNNGKGARVVIDDLLVCLVMNGNFAASGMNFNPEGCIDDNSLEVFIVKYRSRFDIIKTLLHVKMFGSKKLISTRKSEDGFNKFNVNYVKHVKSVVINIKNAHEQRDYFIQLDAEPDRINPKVPVKIEVMPNAVNFLTPAHREDIPR